MAEYHGTKYSDNELLGGGAQGVEKEQEQEQVVQRIKSSAGSRIVSAPGMTALRAPPVQNPGKYGLQVYCTAPVVRREEIEVYAFWIIPSRLLC